MRRMRSREKEAGLNATTRKQKDEIANKQELQRAKWRAQKAKEKVIESPEQRQKRKEKRKINYMKKQLNKGKIPRDAPNALILPETPTKFVNTVMRIIRNSTPRKKLLFKRYGILRDKKREERHARNTRVLAKIKEKLKKLKNSKKVRDRKKFHFLVTTMSGKRILDRTIAKSFDVCAKTWKRYSLMEDYARAKRSDALTESDNTGIQSFYCQNATLLGGSKYSQKDGKHKKILNVTTRKLHHNFQEYLGKQISLSRFRKERPSHILCIGKHKFIGSLCEYCINIEHKIKALGKVAQKAGVSIPAENKFEASDSTVCPYEDYPSPVCISRNCSECGTGKLKELFADLEPGEASWQVWQNKTFHVPNKLRTGTKGEVPFGESKCTKMQDNVTAMKPNDENCKSEGTKLEDSCKKPNYEKTDKGRGTKLVDTDKPIDQKKVQTKPIIVKNTDNAKSKGTKVEDTKTKMEGVLSPDMAKKKKEDKGITKKVLIDKCTPVSELVEKLCEDMQTFTQHLVTAKWQRDQLRHLQESLPDGWVLTIEDYSENFRTCYQDEIQSAHYQYSQVTLYCQVSWYSCPTCPAQIHEAAAFISDDLTHDPYAIVEFHKVYSDYLKKQGIAIEHQVFWSDGCPTQYKAKQPFDDVRTSHDCLGHSSERSFYGTRHGKSECDALGGIMKSTAKREVASRQAMIRTGDEFYHFCKTLEQKVDCGRGKHTSRVIFQVNNIDRPKEKVALNPIYGTQKLHQIRKGSEDGEVLYRNKSCYCEICRQPFGTSTDDCPNKAQTGPWQSHNMLKTKKKRAPSEEIAEKAKGASRRTSSDETIEKKPKRSQSVPVVNLQKNEGCTPIKEGAGCLREKNAAPHRVMTRMTTRQREMNISSVKIKKPQGQKEKFDACNSSNESLIHNSRQLRERRALSESSSTSALDTDTDDSRPCSKKKKLKLPDQTENRVEESDASSKEDEIQPRRSKRLDPLCGQKIIGTIHEIKPQGKVTKIPSSKKIADSSHNFSGQKTIGTVHEINPEGKVNKIPSSKKIADSSQNFSGQKIIGTVHEIKPEGKVNKIPSSKKITESSQNFKPKPSKSKASKSKVLKSKEQRGPRPVLEKDIDKLRRALIHSPYKIQLSTAKGISLPELEPKLNQSVAGLRAQGDFDALQLLPRDIPVLDGRCVPILIEGDGNCLPRVASVLAYGHQGNHLEMRLRIAMELIMFKDRYMDEQYLSQGLPEEQTLTPARVGVLSGNFATEDIDTADVEKLYHREIHEVLLPEVYMGTWQIFALASVLKCPIFSAYPKNLGDPAYRRDLHRFILPRVMTSGGAHIPVIMWSSARRDMNPEHWVPNHFTLVLPFLTE